MQNNQLKLIQKKLHKLNAALFAVQFHLNSPYPDDDRWTPWTRFVQPALKMLSEAVFNNKDIGELSAMAHPDQDPPKNKLYTQPELDAAVAEARIEEHNLVFEKTGELDEADLAYWSLERLKELGVGDALG